MLSVSARLCRRCATLSNVRPLLTGYARDGQTISIQETREKLKDLVGAQRIWGSKIADNLETAAVATSQLDLPVRRMSDSYREAIIPLGSNPALKEKYINFYNGIRFGRILEDLDTFAVAISYTYTLDPTNAGKKSPLSIVTALVDKIEISNQRMVPDRDIKMTGKVTWAGTSSLEVTMDLDQEIDNEWKKILVAKFVMVARNPASKKAAIINKLEPNGPEEEELFKLGQANKLKRQCEGQKTLLRTAPNEEERLLIHDLFLHTLDPK